MSKHSEEIALAEPVVLVGHKVVIYRNFSKRPLKVHKGPTRVTEFAQTIVVHYNGRTDCLEATKWKKELKGNCLTLEAMADQPIHKPVRLDFHLTQ